MGSMIYLSLGAFEVDWGKNSAFKMHGVLFQPGDLTSVPYRYVDEEEQQVEIFQEGAARTLATTVDRLELMGFTLETARHEYDGLFALLGDRAPVSFDEFAEALSQVDIDHAATMDDADYDLGEFFRKEILSHLNLTALRLTERELGFALGAALENLDPYVVLRLLAQNPANASRQVIWAFADVIEGGWVDRDGIIDDLGAKRRFLVVTEGSSDARILKHAFELLRPNVADFFYFVDMEDGYPFTGTGNLHRFCQGLASIEIENRVVVLYDNDAEGVARSDETSKLRLPPNMRVMRLPNHGSLATFRTIGPQGQDTSDINGGAASIECYLDLSWSADKEPIVRWTSYNTKSKSYQGELVDKGQYTKRFLALRARKANYDFSKINTVLKSLISECIAMAAHERTANMVRK